MGALICDVCGGKLVMGSAGMAICESCGLQHSVDRVKEKVQEIKGTVQVDNSHLIENYLEIAENARNSGNNKETESYCNRILEIDPKNYRALILKGEAAAWQSTLQYIRVDECVALFTNGISNAPEESRESLIEDAVEELERVALALVEMRSELFAEYPSEREANKFIDDLNSILDTIYSFADQYVEMYDFEVYAPIDTLHVNIAKKIYGDAVFPAWKNVIWPDYNGDPNDSDDRPGKYEFETFIDRIDACISLLKTAIQLDGENIQLYENLVFLQKEAINSCSWKCDYTGDGKRWHKEFSLTANAISLRQKAINPYETKIKEVKDKRREKYWNEHKKVKQELDTIKNDSENMIREIKEEYELLRKKEKEELKNVERKIVELTAKKENLLFFKTNEKKQIQKEIDDLNKEKAEIKNRFNDIKSDYDAQLQRLEKVLAEINEEFNKER